MSVIKEKLSDKGFYVLMVAVRDENACVSSIIDSIVGLGLGFDSIIVAAPYNGKRKILFVTSSKRVVSGEKRIIELIRDNRCVVDVKYSVMGLSIEDYIRGFLSKPPTMFTTIRVELDVVKDMYLQLIKTFSPTNTKLILRVIGRESGKVAAKMFMEKFGGRKKIGEIKVFLSLIYIKSGRGILESMLWDGYRYILKFAYIWEKNVVESMGKLMERLNFEEGFLEGFFSELFNAAFYCEYEVRREFSGVKPVFIVYKKKSIAF